MRSAALDEVQERKQALRTSALRARRGLSPQRRREASAQIAAKVLALPELRAIAAGDVLAYAALADEVDLSEVIRRARLDGRRVLLPRVVDDELEVVAAQDELRPGFGGVPEPDGPAVSADDVAVSLWPGVAFDPQGGRLGRGGGHYDRLARRLPPQAVRVGVAFAVQMAPNVPRAVHDELVDVVITERGVYRPFARPAWEPA